MNVLIKGVDRIPNLKMTSRMPTCWYVITDYHSIVSSSTWDYWTKCGTKNYSLTEPEVFVTVLRMAQIGNLLCESFVSSLVPKQIFSPKK